MISYLCPNVADIVDNAAGQLNRIRRVAIKCAASTAITVSALAVLRKYSIEAKMLDLMGSYFCVGQIVDRR